MHISIVWPVRQTDHLLSEGMDHMMSGDINKLLTSSDKTLTQSFPNERRNSSLLFAPNRKERLPI